MCRNAMLFNHLQEVMNETFYLSNVLPQDIKNNGGFWNRYLYVCSGFNRHDLNFNLTAC